MPKDSDAIKYAFNYAPTWRFQKVLPIAQLHATPDRQKYALRVLNSLSHQEPQPFRIFQRKDEKHHRLLHHRFISAAAQVD